MKALKCTGYDVRRRPGELPEIKVRLILPIIHETEETAEALKALEIYLSGDINIVKSDGSARCFYCASKAAEADKTCEQCGAPL